MSRRESMAPRLRRKREGWVARSGTGPRSPGEAAEVAKRVAVVVVVISAPWVTLVS